MPHSVALGVRRTCSMSKSRGELHLRSTSSRQLYELIRELIAESEVSKVTIFCSPVFLGRFCLAGFGLAGFILRHTVLAEHTERKPKSVAHWNAAPRRMPDPALQNCIGWLSEIFRRAFGVYGE